MRVEEADALLKDAIKLIEELERLVGLISGLDAAAKRPALISHCLREIASILDSLPFLIGELYTIKKSLRDMLSTDPDKTPPAHMTGKIPFEAFPSSAESAADTTFSAVEDRHRSFSHSKGRTAPGIGLAGLPPASDNKPVPKFPRPPPLPKKP